MNASCDVLVVGAGVAGVAASLAAARKGAEVVLVEKRTFPGGTGVVGMHRFLCGLYAGGETPPETTLNGGLAREIPERLQAISPACRPVRMGKVHVLPFATEDLVSLFRTLLRDQRNLGVRYDTSLASVETVSQTITSVRLRRNEQEARLVPRVVIDCSGDGYAIAQSGARWAMSPPETRQLVGFSFRLKGLKQVDDMLPMRVAYRIRKAVEEGELHAHHRFTTMDLGPGPDEGTCRLNLPPSDWPEISSEAQAEAHALYEFLVRHVDALRESIITEMGGGTLEREGRRLIGEHTLTEEEVVGGRKFPDGAVKNAWPIELWTQDRGPQYRYLPNGEYYEIPLRCMRTPEVGNLYCAGRCISATAAALGSTRVMGTCIALGEAAGIMAAGRALSGAQD